MAKSLICSKEDLFNFMDEWILECIRLLYRSTRVIAPWRHRLVWVNLLMPTPALDWVKKITRVTAPQPLNKTVMDSKKESTPRPPNHYPKSRPDKRGDSNINFSRWNNPLKSQFGLKTLSILHWVGCQLRPKCGIRHKVYVGRLFHSIN